MAGDYGWFGEKAEVGGWRKWDPAWRGNSGKGWYPIDSVHSQLHHTGYVASPVEVGCRLNLASLKKSEGRLI